MKNPKDKDREPANPAVVDEIRRRCPEGRVACAQAFAIAAELDVTPRDVGRAADELGYKIHNCQLGCF